MSEREGLFAFKDQFFIGLGPGDVSPIVPEQDGNKLSILELDSLPPEVHLVERGTAVDVSPDGADGESDVDRLPSVQELDDGVYAGDTIIAGKEMLRVT